MAKAASSDEASASKVKVEDAAQQIASGKTVRLKSGGPLMVAYETPDVDDEEVNVVGCCYFDRKGRFREENFWIDSLVVVTDEEAAEERAGRLRAMAMKDDLLGEVASILRKIEHSVDVAKHFNKGKSDSKAGPS